MSNFKKTLILLITIFVGVISLPTFLIVRCLWPIGQDEMLGTFVLVLPDGVGQDILTLKENGTLLQEIKVNNFKWQAEGTWTLGKERIWTTIVMRDVYVSLMWNDKVNPDLEKKINAVVYAYVYRNLLNGAITIECTDTSGWMKKSRKVLSGSESKTGAPFGAMSDIDFFVESSQLTQGLKTSSNIPGFVHPSIINKNFSAIAEWSKIWSDILGRKVSVGGFEPSTVPAGPVIKQ